MSKAGNNRFLLLNSSVVSLLIINGAAFAFFTNSPLIAATPGNHKSEAYTPIVSGLCQSAA
jgi:hypothetical protein